MAAMCKDILMLAVAFGMVTYASAGSYIFVAQDTAQNPFSPGFVQPFAIVHPVGYEGQSGTLMVRVCVRPEDSQLIPVVQHAVTMWNRLEPTVGNCIGCPLWEIDPQPASDIFSAFDTVLHELGHCAMGLEHPNLHEVGRPPTKFSTGICSVDEDLCCKEATSLTLSVNATRIVDNNGRRGDVDDAHHNDCPFVPPIAAAESTVYEPGVPGEGCETGSPCPVPPQCCPRCEAPDPGPDCPDQPLEIVDVSWFRNTTNEPNNPVIIDDVVIDRTTFTRNSDLLPPEHNYIANANREVADNLGYPNTQTVMYSGQDPETRWSGLTSDEVNMVKMGTTGVDRLAGTADDYEFQLLYVPDCSQADVRVSHTSRFVTGLGNCQADIMPSFPNSLHYSLTPFFGEVYLIIELDPDHLWDYSVPVILQTGFETGDFSEWSGSCPPTCAGGDPEPPPPLP